MSFTIDAPLRRHRRVRRGSILMEFVLVLPLYFALFGYLFLLGDMGLKAISLAAGDRDAAMDAGDRMEWSYGRFSLGQLTDTGLRPASAMTLRADESFQGAWSWQTAGTAVFDYKLPGWLSGFVVYPFLVHGSAASGGPLQDFAKGRTVELRSKGRETERRYGYYTLKRTDLARDPAAYRNWAPNELVGRGMSRHWYTVASEPYANADASDLDANGAAQARDENPDTPNGAKEYKRFSLFVTWSQ